MYNELKILYTSLGPGGLVQYTKFFVHYILHVFVNKTLATVSNPYILYITVDVIMKQLWAAYGFILNQKCSS